VAFVNRGHARERGNVCRCLYFVGDAGDSAGIDTDSSYPHQSNQSNGNDWYGDPLFIAKAIALPLWKPIRATT
jgi:hypothetical protein